MNNEKIMREVLASKSDDELIAIIEEIENSRGVFEYESPTRQIVKDVFGESSHFFEHLMAINIGLSFEICKRWKYVRNMVIPK